MIIEPNSNIKLLKNVPLDKTYNHTIYFKTLSAQTNYFASLVKHNLPQQSYQRVNKGVARIGLSADKCYDCNYIMFQNTAYGTKWFYAFITKVEYINNAVCEITFEIDVMQTWFFDYQIKMCFVEREHSVTDVIGDNIVEEPVELGEVVSLGTLYQTYSNLGMKIVVASSVDSGGKPVEGAIWQGLYSALNYYIFDTDTTGVESCNTLIASIIEAGMGDSIVSVFMCPTEFAHAIRTPQKIKIKKEKETMAGGYIPKNNKLFTYPYSYLIVSNGQGTAGAFAYELFSDTDDEMTFQIDGTLSCNPEGICYPVNYKHILYDYDSGILMNNFPQCSWTGDAFKAWLAQNIGSIALSFGSSLASINNPKNIVSGAKGVVGTIADTINARLLPPQANGSTSNSVNVILDRYNYFFNKVSIRPEYAKLIDDYFTMYGYATKIVKIPNRNSRPHWNYVKTNGCVISGSVPADDIAKICEIHDKGITYWKKGSEVGNYSLNNAP